jgi:phage shock protein E
MEVKVSMRNALGKLWLVVIFATVARPVVAAELTRLTDLGEAQTWAKAENKMVLLFFHGSDWCPTCALMQEQVFGSPKFVAYARDALILVDVDFPETAAQSAELKRANLALKSKFNIGSGLPTIVLLNPAGETVYQELGYAGGGPAKLLSILQRHSNDCLETEEHAKFKNLTVEEFARMAADKRYVVLDVRTSQEFQAGHLPGAINIDVNSPDFAEKARALDRNRPYLVHCASGVRSVKACKWLGQINFRELYNLSGGIRAWVQAGQPVEKQK